MLKIPDKSEFPGTGPQGNGIATSARTQYEWLNNIKSNGCHGCHQIGNKATRIISKEWGHGDARWLFGCAACWWDKAAKA